MRSGGKKRIFLDYASITPLDQKVAKRMEQVQNQFWGNPSSLHTEGEEAKKVLEEARLNIACLMHCRSNEVFFTSGGTESLNLAIFGIVGRAIKSQRPSLAFVPHIIVSAIEHSAVLEPIKFLLGEKSIEVSFIAPDESGIINPESVGREIKENTVLVVVQHANNEIGVIQPIREIKKAIEDCKFKIENSNRPYLLVDACQSALYEDVSIERLGADLLVLDGIKIYGPRGAGILVVRHSVNISPIVYGGGQERGLRSGTESVANALGLAEALELSAKMRAKESKRLTALRDYAIQKILKEVPNSSLNGGLENRLPNNINICFGSISQGDTLGKNATKVSPWDSEFLVIKLDTLGFAVSAASACHTLLFENGSYVIRAVEKARSTGSRSSKCASSSLRITLGRATKKSDLDAFISALKKIIK